MMITGTTGNDKLTGTDDADTIDGLAGADLMTGGKGNDIYYVDDAGDKVEESANGGRDAVIASISYTLGANVEGLQLVGTAVSGIGNGLDNLIFGNDLDNTLDGGKGVDRLEGGLGNDSYYVDNVADDVREFSGTGTGIDTVYASVTLPKLADNVEN